MAPDGWTMVHKEEGCFENEQTLKEYIDAWIARPFDLSREFMLRVELLYLGVQEYLLLIMVHHIAADGGRRVFWCGSWQNVRCCMEGRIADLPVLPVQYGDYALWQRLHLSGELLERKLGYWKKSFQGVSPLNLPTDHRRPAMQSTRGGKVSGRIGGALWSAFSLCRSSRGLTLYMTLLAAFKVLLYRTAASLISV